MTPPVVFTKNATEALNLALHGLLRPGDRVMTSSMEHNAVMRPLRDLERRGEAIRLLRAALARKCFDLAHVQPAIDDLLGQLFRIRLTDQHARVACRQLAGMNVGFDRVGEFQQPQCIGDMAAALADRFGDVVLAVAEFVGQALIARRLFDRIEVGALHILDDSELERFAIARLVHDDRHLVQAGALGRAPTSFASDDLEGIGRPANRTDDDRLNDPALADRRCQLVEVGVREMMARITRIRSQEFDRRPALTAAALGRHGGLSAHIAYQ